MDTPIIYYRFDDGNNNETSLLNYQTKLYDASLSSIDIMKNTNQKLGTGCLSLNNSQYVNINNTSVISGNFSIACWIYITTYQDYMTICELNYNSSNINPFWICLYHQNIFVFFGQIYINFSDLNTTILNTNTWYHIALTVSNSSYVAYVNGVALVLSDGGTTYSGSTYTGPSPVEYHYIGYGESRTTNFIGYIDDFRIYNTTLSASDISTIYNFTYIITYYDVYGNNTYYYDICGNDLYNTFTQKTLLPASNILVPFIGKARQIYSPNYINTTISTLTLNYPTTITFDSTYNNAYICSSSTSVIYRINMYTGVVNLIAGTYTTGSIVSTPVSSYSSIFTYPTSTAFDNSGNFYISDYGTKKISKMNLQTAMITDIVYAAATTSPIHILIDSKFNLYFSSSTGIYKANLLGILPLGSVSTIDSSNIYQMAFAPGNQNIIYGITPTSPTAIRVCNTTNSLLSYSIRMPTGMNNGVGIVFDSVGNLYFCTYTNVYMISNTNIPTISTTNFSNYTTVSSGITYNSLRWLSIDNADNLYITDTVGHVIYKFITNTYNTNYLLPNGLDLGTAFIPKYMLGGTSSQSGSFPLSNYIINSLNSPIEYYIEGTTYNIIDNSGLVCYYMFNYQDISGLNLANYASESIVYDASLSNTGLSYQTDYILGNGCLNLNGSQYVKINNTSIVSYWPTTNGFSVAFWLNASSSNEYTNILTFGSENLLIFLTQYNIWLYINANYAYIPINKNQWYHIVITCDYPSGGYGSPGSNYSIYLNGILTTSSKSGTMTYPVLMTNNSCYIGNGSVRGDPNYIGKLDDFRIYNRVITATEAFRLYSFNGLSLYYKFDTEDVFKGDGISIANYASGYPIYDATLSAVNSQINGISTTSSMVGTACLYLSGNYVNIPTPNISTNGFTVAFWMNTTSTNVNFPSLLYLPGTTTNTNTYIYISTVGSTVLTYECRYNTTTLRTVLSSNITINDGLWHHIVLTSTYSSPGSSTSIINFYIDNTLNISTNTGYYPSSLMTTSRIGYNTTSMYTGLIDDYRVYSRVLSAPEITALYTYTYNPGKLAVTAIGAATFTVTTPKYPGITATIMTSPVVSHTDSVTNNIYKTILTGLSQNVGYGYTFTYSNGLVLTGNTTLYSTPTAPTINFTPTISSITISTQSYSGIPTTAAYFYINGLVIQGTYSSNIYSTTISGLTSNTSYALISNIMNNNSIGQTTSTVYTLPDIPTIPTIAVTTINSNSIVFTFTTTDTVAPSSYIIVINSQTFTSATNTVTATGLSSNTSYSYYGYVSNTRGNSANTTTSSVTTIYKATGGDTIYMGNGYRYHIFTSISTAGTFSTTSGIPSTTFNIVAAGGGGGGGGGANFANVSNLPDHSDCGGGGGAGALYNNTLTATSVNFSITIGDKGSAGRWQGISGSFAGDTIISGTTSGGSITYTMKGGGAGGGGQNGAANPQLLCPGYIGGSGGGSGTNNGGTTSNVYSGGTSNKVAGTTGNVGGNGIGNKTGSVLYYNAGGGGGGALGTGTNGNFTNSNPYGGNGGSGLSLTVYNDSTPIIYYLCAGGGGGSSSINVANGGLAGSFMAGGSGEYMSEHTTSASAIRCTAPAANCYGCGGGGAGGATLKVTEGLTSAPGSQGIVIIYYEYP
jgi:hypothetical protein